MSARTTENGSTGQDLSTNGSGFAITRQSGGSLKLSQEIEQEQDGAEGSFRGKEFVETKPVGSEIVLQLGNTILDIRSLIIVMPDFYGGLRLAGHEDAEGIAGHVD